MDSNDIGYKYIIVCKSILLFELGYLLYFFPVSEIIYGLINFDSSEPNPFELIDDAKLVNYDY